MAILRLLAVPLILATFSLNAHSQNSGPLLWTGYIDTLGNYLHTYSGGGTFSRFTPGVPITVTRVQFQAAQGSYIYNSKQPCHPVPKIRVTDGTNHYDLAVPNARWKGNYPKAVSGDSGQISVGLSGSAAPRLVVLPGEKGCSAYSINVTVQYTIN